MDDNSGSFSLGGCGYAGRGGDGFCGDEVKEVVHQLIRKVLKFLAFIVYHDEQLLTMKFKVGADVVQVQTHSGVPVLNLPYSCT
ncbi:hypothetical protein RJT34_06621 [Clitoria ternatea]|uniref:Uncharacterized protein n=1 Tax=Clitoria ternatea TaxID=43366 RepID=A0AAN9K3Y0_CLITE